MLVTLFAGLSVLIPAECAAAGFSSKDAQILGRTLGFVGDGISGTVIVGVAFDPANSDSRQRADLIRTVIGSGLSTGRVTLQVRLVPADQLAAVNGIDAIYVTPGLSGTMKAVDLAAQRLHVPTVAADLACVEAGNCVVGFSTDPTVEIVIDRGAAARINVRFLQAFRLLVREK
jgi:hypothetical protein